MFYHVTTQNTSVLINSNDENIVRKLQIAFWNTQSLVISVLKFEQETAVMLISNMNIIKSVINSTGMLTSFQIKVQISVRLSETLLSFINLSVIPVLTITIQRRQKLIFRHIQLYVSARRVKSFDDCGFSIQLQLN